MIRYLIVIGGAFFLDLIIEYLSAGQLAQVEIFKASAFAFAAGLSYYLDQESITLPKKLGFSLGVMVLVLTFGWLWQTPQVAVAGVMKFAMVFVAYYLLASFRRSKSLRR